MKKTQFTHLAKVYGIPTYYNEKTEIIKGTNSIYDFLIDICIWFEILLDLDIYDLKITRELKDEEQYQ